MSLSFADVMCFFISVYLLVGVSEKCQIYSFCFSKEERFWTFIGVVYHLIFLFQSSRLLPPILSFQKFTSTTESFIHQFLASFFASWVSFLHSWASFILYWVSFLLISRKNKLVNAKKCFTNNVLCKILITFVCISTHLTEKNEQLFNDIQSFWQLQ